MTKINIGFFAPQPQSMDYGGFDMQMNKIGSIIAQNPDIDVNYVNYWNRDLRLDVGHFWGSEPTHISALKLCKRSGIKTVMNVLFNNDMSQKKYLLDVLKRLIKKIDQFLCTKAFYARLFLQAYDLADLIIVLNENQRTIAVRNYGIAEEKVKIVPVALDKVFFQKSESLPISKIGHKGYALCLGTISERKNQLTALNACIKTNMPIVFIGTSSSETNTYENHFMHLCMKYSDLVTYKKNVHITEVAIHISECAFLLCLSYQETEPAVLMEAMLFGKAIVVSNKPFVDNPIFEGVIKVDINNEESIIKAISIARSKDYQDYSRFNKENYTENTAMKNYLSIYEELIGDHVK